MSISGKYVLSLACDATPELMEGRSRLDHQMVEFGTFEAPSASAARNAARRAGWLIDDRHGRALCPDCRVLVFSGKLPVDSPKKA